MVWPAGEVRTPRFSRQARIQAGFLLRLVQAGQTLGLPHARPMSSVGRHCYELRIDDERQSWRIVYRADPDAIVILEVFRKKSRRTPQTVLDACRERLRRYEDARAGAG